MTQILVELPAALAELPPTERASLIRAGLYEATRARLRELEAKLAEYRKADLFPPFPFGNDFTPEELVIGKALKGLKAKMSHKVGTMAGGIFHAIQGVEVSEKALPYLKRMNLDHPVTFKDKIVQSLLLAELIESGHA